MFQITTQWPGATTHRLLLRDYNSQNRCCGGTRYEGPRQFHQQNDSDRRLYNPSFTAHRHEYHTDSRNHKYHDNDYYYRPNKLKYSNHKSPSSKYSYPQEYYTRIYDNRSLKETKYMQKRKGFVFPDTHNNINDGRGGYRPYIPPSHFQDHRYHDSDFNNFRNKHGHQGHHDPTEDGHRKKYRPALLGVSVGKSGGVVVTGPDGYRHVIHDLPPWTQPNTTPETEHYKGSSHPQGRHLGSHRFTTGFHDSPGLYEYQNYHHETYKGVPTYYLNSHSKNRNQKQGAQKYASDIPNQTHGRGEQYYKGSSKPDNFYPSPPFYRYSEPDPLHHPNGSPLQTNSPTETTKHLTTTSSEASTTSEQQKDKLSSLPRKSLKYPHSINAQLPPPALGTDTTVPYVATEQIPNQNVPTATQVSDANNKVSSIQVVPTESSVQVSTESQVSSSTIMKNDTLPISLIQETSLYPEPAKISIHPTQTVQTEINMKTENFLPTIITEKYYITSDQSTQSQTFNTNMTEPSHNTTNHETTTPPSLQELSDVIQKTDTEQKSSAENKNYTATVYETVVAPEQSSSNPNMSDSGFTGTIMPTEGNTMETLVTQTVHNSAETKSEENSNLTETPNSDSQDVQPADETYKTEEAMYTTTNEPDFRAPSMLKELQTLMNHAQSLNYFYQDYSTTVNSTDGSDQ
jgi:hypothetical protein